MTTSSVFVTIDNTHQTLAQMANLSIDGLKSLTNYYESSIQQMASKRMTARLICLTSLAVAVFAGWRAMSSNTRAHHRDSWGVIACGASTVCFSAAIASICYMLIINDQNFYLNAAQSMLLNRV